MVSEGKSHALAAGAKHTRMMSFWKHLMDLLEMAGRGASIAPFIGEREMRNEVRCE